MGTFPASMDSLYEMLAFVRRQAERVGFEDAIVSKIELACEEALVNIITHGFRKHLGSIEIQCSVAPRESIKIIIKDDGIPYNPLSNALEVDVKAPLEQRTVGGYGVFLVRQIMDDVHYKRENNANVLTLVKNLS